MYNNNNCIYLRSTESSRAANILNYYVSLNVTIAWGLDWCSMYEITQNKIKALTLTLTQPHSTFKLFVRCICYVFGVELV